MCVFPTPLNDILRVVKCLTRIPRILTESVNKLAIEIIRYLNHVFPAIDGIDYHARNQRTDTFEASCNDLGVATNFQDIMNLEGYDTIIMVTNTSECLINTININSVKNGAVIASLCTTSQTGEITGEVYGRQDVNVLFDYDLTRTFTPDMRAADKVGYLQKVILLNDILNGEIPSNMVEKKNMLLTDKIDIDYLEILYRQKFMVGKSNERIYKSN